MELVAILFCFESVSLPKYKLLFIMKYKIFVLLIPVLFAAHFNSHSQSNDLQTLAKWMEGSYSSEKQSIKDTNYFDIRLQIVPIWKDRKDGHWFYVEQAVAKYIDKPYRQRVYHLTEKVGVFESAVFTMNDPLRFTHHADLVEKLTPDSLISRDGCAVILRRKDKKSFEGSTDGKKCPSDRSGASYATSEVTITGKGLHSWDRGFDNKDEQVWGAENGGYDFIKVKGH